MPSACIFSLRPTTAATLSPALGRAAHAAVLELIAAADAELARRLHADVPVKPLTIAPLGALDGRGSPLAVTPARSYDLRVTLLAESVEAPAASWLAAPPAQLVFDGVVWQVERVTAARAAHPWAGTDSYAALLASALRDAARGGGRWALEFATPVTFRQAGRNQPLPLPELVFGSLLDRWNGLAPLPLPDEIRRFAAEALVLNRFDLHSVAVPTKGGALQIGAVGRCAYTATSRDRYGLACIEALARFAFYSGVGAGTTRGFGQARLAPERGPAAPMRPGRPAAV
jgi:CRISPR-associated endoribonuclease Cas6